MDMLVFAQRLKEVRNEKGVSAKELGEALGINKSTIHRYETGELKGIKQPVLQAIADYLNVNPDYLIGATDNKHTVKEAEELLSGITDIQKKILEKTNSLSQEEQQRYLDLLNVLLKDM